MKTKMLLIAALSGAAALTANAGVHFGFSIGLPAPVTVVQRVQPGGDGGYVWVAGYWSNLPTGRVWVPGAWHYRFPRVAPIYERHDRPDWHDGYRGNDRRNGHDRDNRHDDNDHRR